MQEPEIRIQARKIIESIIDEDIKTYLWWDIFLHDSGEKLTPKGWFSYCKGWIKYKFFPVKKHH